MNQLHQSAITQTKNLENSIILYFRASEFFKKYNEKYPQKGIEIMTINVNAIMYIFARFRMYIFDTYTLLPTPNPSGMGEGVFKKDLSLVELLTDYFHPSNLQFHS